MTLEDYLLEARKRTCDVLLQVEMDNERVAKFVKTPRLLFKEVEVEALHMLDAGGNSEKPEVQDEMFQKGKLKFFFFNDVLLVASELSEEELNAQHIPVDPRFEDTEGHEILENSPELNTYKWKLRRWIKLTDLGVRELEDDEVPISASAGFLVQSTSWCDGRKSQVSEKYCCAVETKRMLVETFKAAAELGTLSLELEEEARTILSRCREPLDGLDLEGLDLALKQEGEHSFEAENNMFTVELNNISEILGFNVGSNHEYGLYVGKVQPDSNAADRGIMTGDRILYVNDRFISKEEIQQFEKTNGQYFYRQLVPTLKARPLRLVITHVDDLKDEEYRESFDFRVSQGLEKLHKQWREDKEHTKSIVTNILQQMYDKEVEFMQDVETLLRVKDELENGTYSMKSTEDGSISYVDGDELFGKGVLKPGEVNLIFRNVHMFAEVAKCFYADFKSRLELNLAKKSVSFVALMGSLKSSMHIVTAYAKLLVPVFVGSKRRSTYIEDQRFMKDRPEFAELLARVEGKHNRVISLIEDVKRHFMLYNTYLDFILQEAKPLFSKLKEENEGIHEDTILGADDRKLIEAFHFFKATVPEEMGAVDEICNKVIMSAQREASRTAVLQKAVAHLSTQADKNLLEGLSERKFIMSFDASYEKTREDAKSKPRIDFPRHTKRRGLYGTPKAEVHVFRDLLLVATERKSKIGSIVSTSQGMLKSTLSFKTLTAKSKRGSTYPGSVGRRRYSRSTLESANTRATFKSGPPLRKSRIPVGGSRHSVGGQSSVSSSAYATMKRWTAKPNQPQMEIKWQIKPNEVAELYGEEDTTDTWDPQYGVMFRSNKDVFRFWFSNELRRNEVYEELWSLTHGGTVNPLSQQTKSINIIDKLEFLLRPKEGA